MAHSGQSDRTAVCLLSDNSGQTWILARDGLSAFDPTATLGLIAG
jgi:ligand-binding sensor domain-containing protein